MKLVNDSVIVSHAGIGVGVIFPAIRICGCKIKDHSTFAIDTGCAGVWITGFIFIAAHRYEISIVSAV